MTDVERWEIEWDKEIEIGIGEGEEIYSYIETSRDRGRKLK